MEKCIKLSKSYNCMVEVIEKLTSYPEKEGVLIDELYPEEEKSASFFACNKCRESMLSVLSIFGVIEFKDVTNNKVIKLKSLTSKYFLMSLAEYIKNDITLLSKWEELKGKVPHTDEHNMFNGPQFLYFMEKRRVEECENPAPIREGEVVRVIIKGKSKKNNDDLYLFQFDSKVFQYKLIGGNVEKGDKNTLNAIKREINEELPLSKLKLNNTYRLNLIHESESKLISYVYGAYSKYKLYFYHAYAIEAQNLVIGEHDKWLTIEEIVQGKTKEGIDVFPIEKELIEHMKKLNASVIIEDKESLWKKITSKKLEVAALLLTVLGIIITIVLTI